MNTRRSCRVKFERRLMIDVACKLGTRDYFSDIVSSSFLSFIELIIIVTSYVRMCYIFFLFCIFHNSGV